MIQLTMAEYVAGLLPGAGVVRASSHGSLTLRIQLIFKTKHNVSFHPSKAHELYLLCCSVYLPFESVGVLPNSSKQPLRLEPRSLSCVSV